MVLLYGGLTVVPTDGCGAACRASDQLRKKKQHWPWSNVTLWHATEQAVRKSYSSVFTAIDIQTLKLVTRKRSDWWHRWITPSSSLKLFHILLSINKGSHLSSISTSHGLLNEKGFDLRAVILSRRISRSRHAEKISNLLGSVRTHAST